jgi:hypothetical protein
VSLRSRTRGVAPLHVGVIVDHLEPVGEATVEVKEKEEMMV